ncbi:MAG TPA: helix-turn-helix transcriptional regulator [Candidatus Paceibacterota bacterium]|nr:helix-turn-helix transcriptional regulator [Candidatus Paceibacterota bacterium]
MKGKYKILVDVGRKIRDERQKKGYSQERLGELANLHRTYIGMIERAEKNLTLTSVEKIAKALNKKVSDLLSGN